SACPHNRREPRPTYCSEHSTRRQWSWPAQTIRWLPAKRWARPCTDSSRACGCRCARSRSMSDLPPVRYAHVGDAGIAYRVMGQGPPDLVTIGGPASHLDIMFEDPEVVRVQERLASF